MAATPDSIAEAEMRDRDAATETVRRQVITERSRVHPLAAFNINYRDPDLGVKAARKHHEMLMGHFIFGRVGCKSIYNAAEELERVDPVYQHISQLRRLRIILTNNRFPNFSVRAMSVPGREVSPCPRCWKGSRAMPCEVSGSLEEVNKLVMLEGHVDLLSKGLHVRDPDSKNWVFYVIAHDKFDEFLRS